MIPKYDTEILRSVFKCKLCGFPLLMFGCSNPNCENYYKKQLEREKGEDNGK